MPSPNPALVNTPDAVVLPPPGPHTASVIWLHGLGADGNDFVPVAREVGLPAGHGVKFVFPHAPVRPITINNGHRMRAWYDILSLARLDQQDEPGLADSTRRIFGFLDAERAAGIPSERILLAGFSQGCAMTLHAGLRYPHKLAGMLALSGYLPMHLAIADQAHTVNRETPILMMHGSRDPVVPMLLGTASRDLLVKLGFRLEWHDYPMAHQVCAEQVGRIATWTRERLGVA